MNPGPVSQLHLLPRGAVFTAEQLASGAVAYDDPFNRIPPNLTPDQHGDQPEVARDGGMMSGFDRCNRRFSRFDAIQKIALMVAGPIKLNLIHVPWNLPEPIHVRGIVSPTVHPNPAFGADPFCAAANVAIATGDNHRDIIRILATDAIFGTCVPNRIWRRELTGAFDFGRTACLVAIQAPVRNIAVVPDPIEQLAAPDIVIPAPVLMNPRLDVRFHL